MGVSNPTLSVRIGRVTLPHGRAAREPMAAAVARHLAGLLDGSPPAVRAGSGAGPLRLGGGRGVVEIEVDDAGDLEGLARSIAARVHAALLDGAVGR
jgi:hypothetical protein